MNTKEKITEWIEDNYRDENILLADGFEEAFIGIATQFNTNIAIYDEEKAIQILMKDDCTYEEAVEYFEFNVIGSYVGPNTPAFITKLKDYS